MRKQSKSPVAQCKTRIQALLRECAIIRDNGCVLRNYSQAGRCGGIRKDGGLILQAEHLNTRERNISYGELKNIVCLCKHHHGYWKPQHSRLYWELIRQVIGENRWAWLKKVESDTRPYHMTLWDWEKIELGLRQELKKLAG